MKNENFHHLKAVVSTLTFYRDTQYAWIQHTPVRIVSIAQTYVSFLEFWKHLVSKLLNSSHIFSQVNTSCQSKQMSIKRKWNSDNLRLKLKENFSSSVIVSDKRYVDEWNNGIFSQVHSLQKEKKNLLQQREFWFTMNKNVKILRYW